MKNFLISMMAILGLATLIAAAGSSGSVRYHGVPVFGMAVAVAFLWQWLAFVPAWIGKTEKFYDLVGSAAYISAVLLGLALVPDSGPLAYLVAACVLIWAMRLGAFLFLRIRRDGEDKRFRDIKTNGLMFLMTWSLQGLWVTVTAAAALAAITAGSQAGIGPVSLAGLALWGIGFAFEVVADRQKNVFRADPANQGQFIRHGLWAWCRHPNYFGEILLWTGIAVMALPVLAGWQYATLVSPVFVFLLLTRISGIPLLAKAAKQRWGDDPAWQEYMKSTPALLPRPPKSA